MGRCLFPAARSIHLTPLDNSRTADPWNIRAMFRPFDARIRVHSSSKDALEAAWRDCPPRGLVVVTGSLYLVGEVLPMVAKQEKRGR